MPSHPYLILIVDDALLVVTRIRELLTDSMDGVEVYSAQSFAEGVRMLGKYKLHLLLLDIHLPGKNGIELLKLVKEKFPKVHVIMLTNHTSIKYRNACEELGAAHFIDKSAEFETIPSVIRSYREMA